MPDPKPRLVATLAAAGVPIDTLTVTGPASAAWTYMAGATAEQVAAAEAIVAGYDWSPALDAEYAVARAARAVRDQAKGYLVSPDPLLIAVRSACYALMVSLQQERARSNAQTVRINLIAAKLDEAIGAAGGSVAKLDAAPLQLLESGDSLQDALAQIGAIIDAGGV